jgi:transcription-repair coupling factor (superfamily II helicase)
MLETSSSLAFRSLLKTAAVKSGLARAVPRLTGPTGAATAFHAAVIAQDSALLLVVPTDADVERITGDARFFFSALKGLSDVEAAGQVLPLPSQEVDPYRGLTPHFEVASARARALHGLASGRARLVIASARALLPRLSDPHRLAATALTLKPGVEIAPQDLGERLVLAGFSPEDPVDEHGEFCVRGGVVDLYPAAESQPVRLEFIGDIVESVRRYDAATQRSLTALDAVVVSPQRELLPPLDAPDDPGVFDRGATIVDYARAAGAFIAVFELDDVEERGRTLEEQWRASAVDMEARGRAVPPFDQIALAWEQVSAWLAGARRISQLAVDDGTEPSHFSAHVACLPTLEYHGRINDWIEEIRRSRERGELTVFVAATPGRAERTLELLAEYNVPGRTVAADSLANAAVLVTTGQLTKGFRLPDAGIQVFTETDLFEEDRRAHERRRSAARSFVADFRDLKAGDLVVHVDNGIGRFVGLKKLASRPGEDAQEFMELRYADDDKLFVPLERLDLVQKYTGGANPALDKLGGTSWEKAKARVKKAMRDMAEELLKLYAARKAVAGHAFSPDGHWQQEFGDAFEYELTVDQQNAIRDISKDMESPTPMDRLLCGDVGYGKTEVAMRAAFKAVMDGKQVAVLAPTTVLAFQHSLTLRNRFAGFPVRIDMISRFRSKAEQKTVIDDVSAGRVDVIVGTHRLLSKDVVFRDLGLLIVDEEQRFGVAHKERIKQMRKKVDVLTMTATPIPRTLNMSLAGIRDMSVIETPPRDRLSIQTHVVRFDPEVIARAIRTELERGGQVYLVHNRVESIHAIAELVTRLVPEARVAIGHGQTGEDELERIMVDFVAHKFDVLVATTIVENGLDIPNANTIIINRADRYGLAQLYQLRGRVGRSDRRAYAYLLIPAEQTLSSIARQRLAAIREFSDLGSGFRIAALDLEIRGAGNLLGGEQSGQIEAVGFDTYIKLLDDTVRELKGEDLEDERHAAVNLRLDLRIDESYVPDMNQRLGIYRRLASARSADEVAAQVEELRDRYGPPPPTIENLAEHARIRLAADRLGLESVDRQGAAVVLKFRQDAKLDPAWLMRLVQSRGDLTLLPPAILRLDLSRASGPPRNTAARPVAAPPGRLRPKPGSTPPDGPSASWWTARATAGEVTSGFNRETLTADDTPFDPAAKDGLFERLKWVLTQLNQGLIAS